MSTLTEAMVIELSPQGRPVLDSMSGETPEQKIAHLLLGEIRSYLDACERERLGLEIKYGLEHAEKKYRLQQLNLLIGGQHD